MELGIKKISIDDFKKIQASAKGRGGSGGSRQEYFACKKLEVNEAIVFKYETVEQYKDGQSWAIQFCSRQNKINKNAAWEYAQVSFVGELTVYVAKQYKEKKED